MAGQPEKTLGTTVVWWLDSHETKEGWLESHKIQRVVAGKPQNSKGGGWKATKFKGWSLDS